MSLLAHDRSGPVGDAPVLLLHAGVGGTGYRLAMEAVAALLERQRPR